MDHKLSILRGQGSITIGLGGFEICTRGPNVNSGERYHWSKDGGQLVNEFEDYFPFITAELHLFERGIRCGL